jgi:tetratricopeptide (TPR) repeat protein
MKQVETGHYIKGLHNLLNAHFDLRNYRGFDKTLKQFQDFANSDIVTKNENNRIQCFVYLTTAEVNQHFMEGTFAEGTELVPYIEHNLDEYGLYIDRHRVLVFYYKIASLYFGSGDYGKCIDYLQKIINWKVDLRNDLQSYARLLHLLAHYELGNDEIIEHLVRSVYRYMAKMENLTVIEEEMFAFLRRNFNLSPRKLQPEFQKLLERIQKYEKSRFETRSFAYLDIISWLQGKVEGKSMSEVIRGKYLASKRR